MASYGEYQTGRELYRSGLIVVATARAAGSTGAESFAVKVCRASEDILGTEAARRAVAAFLARAKVQKAAAGPHWAPVHAADKCDEGAYCVTTLYARSVQRLAAGRIKLDAVSMRTIVAGVLGGLVQLQTACGRAHGAIRPGNVLIGGTGAAPITEIVLSDPAESSPSGGGSPTLPADLRALGELIHLLILHELPLVRGGWPIAMSPGWSRLGPLGAQWLLLCNRLLDPGLASQPPSLEAILGELPSGTGKRRGKPLILAGAGLAVVGVCVVAGLMLMPKRVEHQIIRPTNTEWKQLAQDYDEWFDAFLEEVQKRKSALAGDAFLARVVATLGKDPASLTFERVSGESGANSLTPHEVVQFPEKAAGSATMLKPDTLQRKALAEEIAATLKEMFSEKGLGGWGVWTDARAAADASRNRGWKATEAYLRELAGGVHLNDHLVESLLAVRGSTDLVVAVNDLDKLCQQLEATKDPALTAVVASVAKALGTSATGQSADAIKKSLDGPRAKLRDLTKFLASADWAKVDKVRLGKREPDRDAPFGQIADTWMAAAKSKEYTVPGDPDPRTIEPRLETLATDVDGTIKKLQAVPGNEARATEFKGRLAELQTRAASFATLPWAESNRDQILRDGEELKRGVVGLGKEVTFDLATANQSAVDLIAELKKPESFSVDSPSMVKAWNEQRQALLDAAGMDVPRLKAGRKNIQDFLKGCWAKFPDAKFVGAGRAWQRDLESESHKKREEIVAKFLASLKWESGGNPPQAASSDGPAAEYASWVGKVNALATDMSDVEARLDALYPLDERVDQRTIAEIAEKLTQTKASPELQGVGPSINIVLGRIQAQRDIENSPLGTAAQVKALVALSADKDRVKAMAAWRRLGAAFKGKPDLDLLKGELTARRLLEGSLKDAGDAERLRLTDNGSTPDESLVQKRIDALRNVLATQGQQRWSDYMLRGAPETLSTALTLARDARADQAYSEQLRINLIGEESKLDPRVRFNIALSDLAATLNAPATADIDAAALTELVKTFSSNAEDLLKPTPSAEPQRQFLASLDPFLGKSDAKPLDPKKMGPGSDASWEGKDADGNIVFKRGGTEITFHRVTQPPDVDAYVSVDEVSVGQVASALTTPEQWAQLKLGLRVTAAEMTERTGDKRDGPRSWEWGGVGSDPASPLRKADHWIRKSTTIYNNSEPPANKAGMVPIYPDETGEPTPPTLDSPMNFVPAEAALYVSQILGCRLPTSTEWKVAVLEDMKLKGQAGSPADYVSSLISSGSSVPNLRDKTWLAQLTYMNSLAAQKPPVQQTDSGRPYNGSYSMKAALASARDPALCRDLADNTLWFWSVTGGSGSRFHNLVGNVAELVLDSTDPLALPPDAKLEDCWSAISPGKPGSPKVGVIGASALSPSNEDATQAIDQQLKAKGQSAFSDVGFRLAFSAKGAAAGAKGMAQQLRELLKSPPYFHESPASSGG